ncbi:MAG: hypothetical protein JW750_10540 [Anaerolineaceae bacterium]|nr:hypothetical protein [Anaerolineaceae bacterium]
MKTQSHHQDRFFLDHLNATHVIAATIGVIFGLSGMNHGLFEVLQGNRPTSGLIIQAIGPEQRFWPLGTEEAFTVIPNFLISGILAMLVGLLIVIWSLKFLRSRRGPTVFLALFILLFLVGGGIGQIAFFVPAWAFATRIGKPLTRWQKILPAKLLPVLSVLWLPLLIITSLIMLFGLQMAIFGFLPGVTDPETIRNTAMLLVFSSALLYILTFIAGLGHEIRRMGQAK